MKSTEPKSPSTAARAKEANGNAFFSKGKGETLASENEQVQAFFAEPKHETPFFDAVQPKLKVHPSNDSYEKEADATADRVVQGLRQTPTIQRKEGEVDEGLQTKPIADTLTSVQTKRAFDSPSPLELGSSDAENDQPVQRKGAGEPESASSALESQLQSSKGQGSPLPAQTRSSMESGFGADFGGVRAHTGSNAVQMNQQLGARAFTHGNDVYFNQGEFQPGTEEGDRLLAHELTHTVQQGAAKKGGQSVQSKKGPKGSTSPNGLVDGITSPNVELSIQRLPDSNAVIAKTFEHLQKGKIDTDTKEIVIPTIKVPDFKAPLTKAGQIKLPKVERSNQQAQVWDQEAKKGFVGTDKLNAKLVAAKSPKLVTPTGEQIYAFKASRTSGDQSSFVIGNEASIKESIARPRWDKIGNRESYQVDHKHEFQLGGADKDIGNLWLLQAQANMSSGSVIRIEKDRKINDLLTAASTPGPKQVWPKKPNIETIKRDYTIEFKRAEGGLSSAGKTDKVYSLEDITSGQALNGLAPLSSDELKKFDFSRSDVLNIFTRQSGGSLHSIENWDPQAGEKVIHIGLGVNMDITKIKYNDTSGGTIEGNLFKGGNINKFLKTVPYVFEVKPMAGMPHTGYIDYSSIRKDLKEKLKAKALSPVEIGEIAIESGKGLTLQGKILPSIPILEKAGIDLIVDGDDIYLEKVFSTGEFKVPAPFKISDSSLTIRAGTQGIEFEGQVDFGIDRVGEGSLSASVNSQMEFKVNGHFEFDKKLFDNAKIEVSYEKGQWAAKGTVEIPKGKVKGIKKASAIIAYSEGTLSAAGQVEPEIKGVKEGSFEIKYSQEQFLVTGKLQLSPEIPKLKRGEINVSLESNAEGGYKLKGNGVAEFDFPGISTGLNVQYDDGLMTVEATVNFEKGIAKGEIKVGATNRPVDAQGNPQGEPGARWVIYGSGSVTIKLTKWLQATAGVKFLPNGEMEVVGRVELPSTVDVFPRKEINKNLFSMPTIEIPLFAIPLGPKSLGLVAQINGGLDFTAGIGPGQIQQLFGEIRYNPARPDETTLTGGGRFVIPADAGLKLHADLTLGLSVGIASLTGGIEVAGSLGLQGEAAASVNLNWSKATGLELFAEGSVTVSPKFKFDVNLIARAKLDLFLFELSKEWRHNLVAVEWGPGIEFGLKFPIHYKDGQEFKMSFEDIQVIKPDIDIAAMVKGVAKKVKDAF